MPPMEPTPPAADPALSSSGLLEDLVAGALEALDRGGEDALAAFLQRHPGQREQVLALITQFRSTGLLARDARVDIPERLGEFRLLKRLGGGGMGVVFIAEQESLRRQVALKVIRPDLLFFDGARERFQREIEVIARLAHPAIVPIVATGEHDRVPWYAMTLIEGCSVDDVVRRLGQQRAERLTGAALAQAIRGGPAAATGGALAEVFAGSYWEACVHLIRQAALGLAHAHHRGIVHRDLKPSNVMLTPDGRALLLDFGLALVRGDARLTRAGGEPGSPAYMAPEQVRGVGADERSDVYSLAATLFQLLDLEAPFVAGDLEQLRQKVLHGQVHPLRNPSVPRELRIVLAAAMDLDRERRHATADGFAADLQAVLLRRPIVVRALPWRLRAARWAQRHRTATALLAAVLVVAAGLPGALAWQQSRALAVLAEQKARVELGRDQALQAVTEFLVRFGASDLVGLPNGQRIAAGMLDRALQILDAMRAEGDSPALQEQLAHAERSMLTALRQTGRCAEARERALRFLANWSGTSNPTPELAMQLAGARTELVRLTMADAPLAELEAHYAAAVRDLEIAAHEATMARAVVEVRAQLLSLLGTAGEARGVAEQAQAMQREALALLERDGARDADRLAFLATLRNRLGHSLWQRGELAAAAQLFQQVETDLTPVGDPTSGRPEDLRLWGHAAWGLARIACSRQQYDQGRVQYERAVHRFEASAYAYPDDLQVSATLACALTELAQLHQVAQADWAVGLPMLERARGLFRRVGAIDGETATNQQTNLRALCMLHAKLRQPAELAAVAREIVQTTKVPQHLATGAWHLLHAAELTERAGQNEAAGGLDAEALAALLACEAAGWFPPIDLSDAPCGRLAGEPAFEALRERHPAAQVEGRRSPRR